MSKKLFKTPVKQVYFKCPNCFEMGTYVVGGSYNSDFVICGIRRCGRVIRLAKNSITEEEYRRLWGWSTALKTKKD